MLQQMREPRIAYADPPDPAAPPMLPSPRLAKNRSGALPRFSSGGVVADANGMSRRWSLPILFGALPVLGSCTSYEALDLRPYLEQQAFAVTQGPVPGDADTVGLTVVQDSGFYIFGVLPVVPVSLDACVRALVREAQKVGADGVAEVKLDYRPSGFLIFSATFMSDWTGAVKLSGCAWRKKHLAAPAPVGSGD
jgi:hypothetical protein